MLFSKCSLRRECVPRRDHGVVEKLAYADSGVDPSSASVPFEIFLEGFSQAGDGLYGCCGVGKNKKIDFGGSS